MKDRPLFFRLLLRKDKFFLSFLFFPILVCAMDLGSSPASGPPLGPPSTLETKDSLALVAGERLREAELVLHDIDRRDTPFGTSDSVSALTIDNGRGSVVMYEDQRSFHLRKLLELRNQLDFLIEEDRLNQSDLIVHTADDTGIEAERVIQNVQRLDLYQSYCKSTLKWIYRKRMAISFFALAGIVSYQFYLGGRALRDTCQTAQQECSEAQSLFAPMRTMINGIITQCGQARALCGNTTEALQMCAGLKEMLEACTNRPW